MDSTCKFCLAYTVLKAETKSYIKSIHLILINISWQLYQFRDPGKQLKWLTDVLRQSRIWGEKVHIVGHLPPGQNECSSVWSRNFYEIVNR